LFLKALVFFPLLPLLPLAAPLPLLLGPLTLLVLLLPLAPAPLLLLVLLRSTGMGVDGLAGAAALPLVIAAVHFPPPPPRCCFTLLLGVIGQGTGRAYTLPDRMYPPSPNRLLPSTTLARPAALLK
jgi:hypothetical protein